jgi:hypothetical protein
MTSLPGPSMNASAEKTGDPQIRRERRTEIGHGQVAGEAARQNPGLFVGRFNEAVDAATMLRAFTKGKDIRVAGGEPVIDHDPTIDRKPCFAGEFRIRPYADRADHEIGGKDACVGEFNTGGAMFAQNPFCVGAEQHLDALGLDRALEKGGRLIIELALHQAVHQMDKRHFHACLARP